MNIGNRMMLQSFLTMLDENQQFPTKTRFLLRQLYWQFADAVLPAFLWQLLIIFDIELKIDHFRPVLYRAFVFFRNISEKF